jgi:hypothetical protein
LRLAGRTGADADNAIERAEANQTGEERHETKPTPSSLGPEKDKGNEHKAENDAQCAINGTFVTGHDAIL